MIFAYFKLLLRTIFPVHNHNLISCLTYHVMLDICITTKFVTICDIRPKATPHLQLRADGSRYQDDSFHILDSSKDNKMLIILYSILVHAQYLVEHN